jgi:hypothetical protein
MPKKPPTDHYVSFKSLVYNSPAFRTLPSSALKLWVDLRIQFRGGNNGNISASMSTLRHRGWRSPETLNRALWELLKRGLLRRMREGKPGPLRLCALFSFTDLPTSRNDKLGFEGAASSMEFESWVPGVSFAPDSKAKKLPRNPSKKKTPLRKSERQRFDNRTVTATNIEQLGHSAATKIGAEIPGANGLDPAAVLASEPIVH